MENMIVQLGDVNINETVGRLLDFVGEKKSVTINNSPFIYMAPCTLRDLSPRSFQPQVVSIGPLHRRDENLQRFEVPKAALVHDLLYRVSVPSPTETLTACVQKVASMIEKIRGCYADIKSWDDIELTIMMVMDACFILEFVYNMSSYPQLRFRDQQIPYDLLLLENQIPFFVLQDVYLCLAYYYYNDQALTEFIHPLLESTNIFQGRIKVGGSHLDTNQYHDHILGYLHHCYQPKYDLLSGFPQSTSHSVVELNRVGVMFTPNHDAEWPMAMEVKMSRYCSNIFCTLKMPILRIDDFTELVLRNLNAYEVTYMRYPYFTSYVWAMDMLVHTHDDIAKLVKSKVMVNHIGSNGEAAYMIKRLCKELVPEHFYYTQEWKQLDSHCKRYLPIKIAKLKRACFQLKRTYFSSPWSTIALFAGIIIFVLTWLQTIFTIKSSV